VTRSRDVEDGGAGRELAVVLLVEEGVTSLRGGAMYTGRSGRGAEGGHLIVRGCHLVRETETGIARAHRFRYEDDLLSDGDVAAGHTHAGGDDVRTKHRAGVVVFFLLLGEKVWRELGIFVRLLGGSGSIAHLDGRSGLGFRCGLRLASDLRLWGFFRHRDSEMIVSEKERCRSVSRGNVPDCRALVCPRSRTAERGTSKGRCCRGVELYTFGSESC
jgi:hypothetical protein